MVSNALFLTPDKFQSLVGAGMHSMTISMDGSPRMPYQHKFMGIALVRRIV